MMLVVSKNIKCPSDSQDPWLHNDLVLAAEWWTAARYAQVLKVDGQYVGLGIEVIRCRPCAGWWHIDPVHLSSCRLFLGTINDIQVRRSGAQRMAKRGSSHILRSRCLSAWGGQAEQAQREPCWGGREQTSSTK